ncbi:hypothetical protein CAOG_05053 [Capsaspora owczarzaki ATCC 30864]|uniref:hypothetical protein n=1 Tax=Capsaspora owczarzaki (strain ATCC 30864) TaxID=595528 RepID=UPI0001FE2B08|nr:hypothetical protein CAOG_05053 [Capsaspora owczarzaki ATCC 30864]|eukprot:XP_004346738.1 hypothetical protein CAOG_05053 [Capsaspora owczarzaki ATCC 30864]
MTKSAVNAFVDLDKTNSRDLGEYTVSSFLHSSSNSDPKVKRLIKNLMVWLNSITASQKVIVRDLAQDLYDGIILINFLQTVTGKEIKYNLLAQSDKSKRENLTFLFKFLKQEFNMEPSEERWTFEGIFRKDIAAILMLCVELGYRLECPNEIPSNVRVAVVNRVSNNGVITNKTVAYDITDNRQHLGALGAEGAAKVLADEKDVAISTRDVIDDLFEANDPERLQLIQEKLVQFVNNHLRKISVQVTDLALQFHDGVYLILLLGSLGDFYVPMNMYHLTPINDDMKVHNAEVCLQLLEKMGLSRNGIYAREIVTRNLKTIVRFLYLLYTAYRPTDA